MRMHTNRCASIKDARARCTCGAATLNRVETEIENEHARRNAGNTKGVPESWADVASHYQGTRQFLHAAEAWEHAAGVTLGHFRAERYESAATWCRSQAAQAV